MALLVHSTSPFSIKHILKDNALKPSCESGSVRYTEDCFEDVYMSVFHPFQSYRDLGEVAFFFKPDILQKYNTIHWSPTWSYGKETEHTIKYDKSKTPEENIKIWGQKYRKVKNSVQFSPGLNTNTDEVIIRNSIPLQDNLIGIYIPQKIQFMIPKELAKIPEHLLIKTRPALTKFLQEHT